MKRSLPLAALLAPAALSAQLTVNDSLSTTYLTTLLEGLNITLSNLVVNCPPDAHGEFSGSSEIPITQGLVLTSGTADAVAGPVGDFASGGAMGAGDPDLDGLVSAPTLDACVLEFDCVPLGDTLLFNFVFGSEEYPEFAGTAFNDAFAIWLSGPGYPIPTNVAAIPGGTLVSINNVNAFTNAAYYVDNEAIPGVYCAYDGFTQNLTAFAVVAPGATYHFKVAVADVSDGIFDTGVFLEAFSFRSVMGVGTAIGQLPEDGLHLRPNGDLLEVRVPDGSFAGRGRIINDLGRTVRAFDLSGQATVVPVGDLRSGHYVVEFSDGRAIMREAFVKY